MYERPFAAPGDSGRRQCGVKEPRTYRPKYKGIGFQVLDSESEACFVPDQQYKLLDELVNSVVTKVKYNPNLVDRDARIEQAKNISKAISDTLKANGFALFIPTESLGDALISRNRPGEPERHIFDCDTGSLIFLTIAENLGAPVSLVDITLPSDAGHNYVRWYIDDKTSLDWDMNGQAECSTPADLPNYEGRSMSRDETLGYALGLRASIWETLGKYDSAISDYREPMKLYPQDPVYYNNFAWIVATRQLSDRKQLQKAALTASEHATTVNRTANYLDTLACVYALTGDFKKAITLESEAVKTARGKDEAAFRQRLAGFMEPKPRDCTGAK
jgi:tetratricopeptide (TPR) repeat protein